MVHKKFTYKNGKKYGPYIYESERVGEKVITHYKGKPSFPTFFQNNKNISLTILIIVALAVAALFLYREISLTGNISLDVNKVYNVGEPLSGDVNFKLSPGEFIPKDSIVVVSHGSQRKEYPLSAFSDLPTAFGTFYAKGSSIEGRGEGYGVLGKKTSYPTVNFDILISNSGSSSDVIGGGSEGSEVDLNESSEISNIPESSENASAGSTGESDGESEQVPEESVVQPEPAPESQPDNGYGITGSVIDEDNYIVHGKVSKGDEFGYNLELGQSAELVSGTVQSNGTNLADSEVNVDVLGDKVIVSTDYKIEEEGFGPEFNEGSDSSISIDVSNLNITAEKGSLDIALEFNGEEIVSASSDVVIKTPENVSDIPLTNLSLIKDIPQIRIAKNGVYELDLGKYFSGAERYEFVSQNISETFNGETLTLVPNSNFSGVRKAKILASLDEETIESNEFNIIVSSGNLKITTLRDDIKVGEPVRWVKNVSSDVAEEIRVEIPAEAENISVSTIDSETGKSEKTGNVEINFVSGSVISGQVTAEINLDKTSWFAKFVRNIFGSITGNVIEEGYGLNEVNDVVENNTEIVLSDNATDYVIEYYTEAPVSTETETEVGKQVVVSANSELNYTDVLSFANISEVYSVGEEGRIKIFWVEGNQYVPFDAYDMSGNDKLDYVEWITPHLSSQTFEIILGSNVSLSGIEIDGNYRHLSIPNADTGYGLVAYYSFDKVDGTTIYDLTNDSIDGNLVGGAITSAGLYGDSLTLDGTGYANLTRGALQSGTDFAYSMWVNIASTEMGGTLFDNGDVSLFIDNSDGDKLDAFFVAGGETGAITGDIDMTDSTWHNVIFMGNSSAIYLYIDGSIRASTESTWNGFSEGNLGYLGEGYQTPTTHIFGQIDDVMIFNRILSEQEIADIYNNQSRRFASSGIIRKVPFNLGSSYTNLTFSIGDNIEENFGTNVSLKLGEWDVSKGYNETMEGLVAYYHGDGNVADSSGNGNDGTLQGDANAGVDGFYNNAISFDGAGDYVQLPSSESLYGTTVSVAAWVYPTVVDGDEIIAARIGECETFATYAWQLYSVYSGTPTFKIWTGGDAYTASGSALPINEWSFVTGTYTGNSIKLYINGELVNTASSYSMTDAQVPTLLGADVCGNNFGGKIDEAMIFNRVLSASEVRELYDKGRLNWTFGDYQMVESNASYSFNISSDTTNVLPEFNLTSDIYGFYTPYFYGNISLVARIPGPPLIEFISPTLENSSIINVTSAEINVTINTDSDLSDSRFNWNGTNYSANIYNDLIVWYKADGSVNDSSGNGYNGTFSGDANADGIGIYDRAFSFNGQGNGYYVLSGSTSFGKYSNFTISAWVNVTLDPVQQQESIISFANAPGKFHYNLHYYDGNIVVDVGDMNNAINSTPVDTIGLNEWHFITTTLNGNDVCLYDNSVLIGCANYLELASSSLDNNDGLIIGADFYDVAWQGYMTGLVDDVMVFNKTLNQSEISKVYSSSGLVRQINSTQWKLYINQTGLVDENYTYYVCASNIVGENCTEERTLNVQLPLIIPPAISFVSPTPENSTTINVTSSEINVSISTEEALNDSKFNWNGANYSMYDSSLVVMIDGSSTEDYSLYNNTGSLVEQTSYVSGKYGNAYSFDGDGDFINIPSSVSIDSPNTTQQMTIGMWINISSGASGNNYLPLAGRKSFEVADLWGVYASRVLDSNYGPTIVVRYDGLDYVCASDNSYEVGEESKWIYLTFVYNGSDAFIYEDSNLTKVCTLGVPLSSGGASLAIGRRDTDSWENTINFAGLIDEFRMWNRALTAAEIGEYYSSNLQKIDSTQWNLYINQSSLSDLTNYTYYVCASNAGEENCTEERTLNVDLPKDKISPNVGFISPTPEEGSVLNESNVILNVTTIDANQTMTFFNDSLVARYTMDDTGYGLIDQSGNGNDGTANGGVTIGDGMWNKSISFDGATGYVDLSLNPITFQTGTISFWAKPNEISGTEMIFNGDNCNNNAQVFLDSSKVWIFGKCGFSSIISEAFENQWQMVTAISDESGMKLYINGVLAQESADTMSSSSSFNQIGVRNLNGLDSYFSGSLDEVLIFNRALSASEVYALYNSSDFAMERGFGNLIVGNYSYTAVAIDRAGNTNSTTRSFSVEAALDTTAPTLTITYPENVSYSSSVTTLDSSAFDDALLDSCWYSVDGGENNISMTCGETISGLSSSAGNNTWIVYANDSVGNANSTSVTFRYQVSDSENPGVLFLNPTPAEGELVLGNNGIITLNVSTSDSGYGTLELGYGDLELGYGEGNIKTFTLFNDGLVGRYSMNSLAPVEGGYVIVDESGYGNDATGYGTLELGYGQLTLGGAMWNNSIVFDGESGYGSTGIVTLSGQLTLSAWVKPNEKDSSEILSKTSDNNFANDFAFAFKITNFESSGQINMVYSKEYDNSLDLSSTGTISFGKWSLVTTTLNQTSLSIYINGVLDRTLDIDGGMRQTNGNIRIGKFYADELNYFDGSMDEVLIFNRSLSASEIYALYNSSDYALERELNLGAGNYSYTALSVDRAGNTNSTTRSFSVQLPSPLSVSFVSPTPDEGSTVESESAILNVTAGESGNGVYSFINNSLTAWLRFDNSSAVGEIDGNIYDWSGNGNNGSSLIAGEASCTDNPALSACSDIDDADLCGMISGCSFGEEGCSGTLSGSCSEVPNENYCTNNVNGLCSWTAGIGTASALPSADGMFAGAYTFDGVDDYVNLSSNLADFGTGDFTISLWFNIADLDNWKSGSQAMFSNSLYDGMTWDGLQIAGRETGALSFTLSGSTMLTNEIFNQSQWYNFVVTHDSGFVYLYVNGVFDTYNDLYPDVNVGRAVLLGRNPDASYPNYFNGSIDEVLIFNRAFSAEEVSALYNSTSHTYSQNVSLSNGEYSYTAYAIDNLGNMTTATRSFSVSIPDVAPVVTISSPSDLGIYTTLVGGIEFSVTDDHNSLDSCWYSVDGGATSVSVPCNEPIEGLNAEVGSGMHTWIVWANDSAGNEGSSTVSFTVNYPSCIQEGVCVAGVDCAVASDCYLSSSEEDCTDGICNFNNFEVGYGVKVHTSANRQAIPETLNLNLSGTITFLGNGSGFDFSGINGTVGGNAGIINITVPNLFNTTFANFVGVGGYSSESAVAGGNGGVLQLNFHGLIGKFDDDQFQIPGSPGQYFASNAPLYSGGNSTDGLSGSDGGVIYVKSLTCPVDADITGDGRIDSGGDVGTITSNYRITNSNQNYSSYYDINCDNKLNIIEIAREGFEWQRGDPIVVV